MGRWVSTGPWMIGLTLWRRPRSEIRNQQKHKSGVEVRGLDGAGGVREMEPELIHWQLVLRVLERGGIWVRSAKSRAFPTRLQLSEMSESPDLSG